VFFVGNTAVNPAGSTISLQNVNVVRISDAYFSNNNQINIQVELSRMSVINSNFTLNDKNHIRGIDSTVTLDNVHMYNTSFKSSGHGFECIRCRHIGIQNSRFENLVTNGVGGAIKIETLFSQEPTPVSYIIDSSFEGN